MSGSPITKYLNNLTKQRQPLIPMVEVNQDYVPFIMNRFLSYRPYALPYAAEMNKKWNLSKYLQYAFYFFSVPKLSGYYPADKKEKQKNEVGVIAEFYDVSMDKANEYLKLLTEEQIKEIMRFTTGRNNGSCTSKNTNKN